MDPFIGMIRAFAFPQAPKGWAACNGQIIPINQNQALYSLLGTNYGGDGVINFALPDLRGRAIVGSSISDPMLNKSFGNDAVTLNQSQMPSHKHMVVISGDQANSDNPVGNTYAKTNDPAGAGASLQCYSTSPSNLTNMLPANISGGSLPLNIRNPFLGINYCICLSGIYPSRD